MILLAAAGDQAGKDETMMINEMNTPNKITSIDGI